MTTSISAGRATQQGTRNPGGFWSDDNFLTKIIDELKRGVALLDLVFTNQEELVRDVKVKGSIGCSDHGLVEFRILRGGSKTETRITTLDFRRADCGLFRDLLKRIPQYTALGRREVQES